MLTRIAIPYTENASDYFAAISDLPWPVWLDSGGRGRYDILSAAPVSTLVTQGFTTEIYEAGSTHSSNENPITLLRERLSKREEPVEGVRFAGGVLGYWSYDFARTTSKFADIPKENENMPVMATGIYDWSLQIDHHLKKAELLSWQHYADTAEILLQVQALLKQGRRSENEVFHVRGAITSNFTRHTYARAFSSVQSYLHEGDCYQVNLAQRFTASAGGEGFVAYQRLREISPSPYGAFLKYPFAQILCASPERFLRVEAGKVETRPIKGTRPASADAVRNEAMIEDLKNNPKDRAENLMIVDLLRNDLGKHCAAGTVKVPRLFEVESYATVHHLVSTVTGELENGHDALDLLLGCFPGGSITGAPKQRAMEIIKELEPDSRDVYCGAIGYIGFDGNMDTNIAIRTLVYADGEIRCWAGGGIVADSQAEAEYQETLDKAAAMLEVMRQFGAQKFVPVKE